MGKTEGDPGGSDPEGGGVTVSIHAFRPETRFSSRKRKPAKARVTAASYASFREFIVSHDLHMHCMLGQGFL